MCYVLCAMCYVLCAGCYIRLSDLLASSSATSIELEKLEAAPRLPRCDYLHSVHVCVCLPRHGAYRYLLAARGPEAWEALALTALSGGVNVSPVRAVGNWAAYNASYGLVRKTPFFWEPF